TRRRRESWIRVVLNPHHEQRTTRRVSATSTTSFSTRSTTTAITRMRRRCRRTDIASGSIRAPSLLGDFDITEYRGALTLTLALPQASASPPQRAVSTLEEPTPTHRYSHQEEPTPNATFSDHKPRRLLIAHTSPVASGVGHEGLSKHFPVLGR